MNFAQRLHDLRVSNNLTQTELSDHIDNVSRSALAMYEQGRRKPDFETLDEIADYFDVSFDYLYGKTDINTGYPSKHINDDPLYGLRGNESYKIMVETKPADTPKAHLYAYVNAFNTFKDIFEAYEKATPEIRQAVCRILQVEEPKDGDR